MREPHVDQKHRQAVGALLGLLPRRGAREQQHQVGMLGARGPDLLAVDDVMVVAFAPRRGAQRQRVGARGRLGDAESLQAQFAAGDRGQIGLLLRGAAVPQDRAHGVHLRVAGGAVAAGGMHLFQDRGRGAQAEPAAAVFFRDERGEIAGFGQRRDEFGRIGALAVERAPVFAGKLGAQRAHAVADVGDGPRWRACVLLIARSTSGAAVVDRHHVALQHARRGSSPRRRRARSRCGWSRPERPAPKTGPAIAVSRAGS